MSEQTKQRGYESENENDTTKPIIIKRHNTKKKKTKRKDAKAPSSHGCLSERQQHAYERIANEDGNIVLLGPAGTGKSHVINKANDALLQRYGSEGILTIAPTKMTAQNLDGLTIAAGLGMRPVKVAQSY